MARLAMATAGAGREIIFIEQFMNSISCMRDEFDRVAEDFPVRWLALTLPIRLAALRSAPAIEMTETDHAYNVTVEVFGLTIRDIDIKADEGLLVIKGQKNERDYTLSERDFESFERRIQLPADAELGAIRVGASGSVLKITIPRCGRGASFQH